MTAVALAAQSRTETGKGVARSLRRQALIPAVFYGPEIDPIPLTSAIEGFGKTHYTLGRVRIF